MKVCLVWSLHSWIYWLKQKFCFLWIEFFTCIFSFLPKKRWQVLISISSKKRRYKLYLSMSTTFHTSIWFKKNKIKGERMRLPMFARSEGKYSSVVSVSLSLFSSSISLRSLSFKLYYIYWQHLQIVVELSWQLNRKS